MHCELCFNENTLLSCTGTGSNNVLRQVSVPIISSGTCSSAAYYGQYFNDAAMICAGYEDGGRDSCQVSLMAVERGTIGCMNCEGSLSCNIHKWHWLARNEMTGIWNKLRQQQHRNWSRIQIEHRNIFQSIRWKKSRGGDVIII